MKNPWLASFYSLLLPGLGQIYLKEYGKGITLLCMTAGIVVSLIVSHSWLTWLFMGLIYLAIVVPAAVDVYQGASGKARVFSGESVVYVIVMLFAVGPFAIPLLWQSQKFSKGAKIGWTIFVILIALAVIVTMTFVASFLEEIMKQSPGIMPY